MVRHAVPLALALLVASTPCRADAPFVVERVVPDEGGVEVVASADLGPVEAVVREHAGDALRRAAPDLFTTRTVGPYRYSDVAVEVGDVRYARGATAQQVAITVDADLFASVERWTVHFDGLFPSARWEPRGRTRIAGGTLTVRVDVAIADGHAVVLRILGDRVRVRADVLDGLALDLRLDGRLLHTHAQPIPDHPSLRGLRPARARLLAIDDRHIQFAVRFARTG